MNNATPVASVLMPAYNVEPYIGDAIQSVLDQTFGDLELLVVDDGATDRTAAIAREYARGDGRVRVLQQPNAGLSSARNMALRHARGTYLAILDSDDMWMPSYLQRQVDMLQRQPEIDIVTANGRFLGGPLDGQPARPYPDPRPAPDLATIIADEMAVFIMSVFHRRVYERIGGFDEGFRTNEDYDFWLRAALAGFRFARNDEPLAYYRQRSDSLSASDVRMLTGILRVYTKLRPQLAGRPAELAIMEAQFVRLDTERLAAEARLALETGDGAATKEHLRALYRRRGGTMLRMAAAVAEWTPGLLARAYRIRRFVG